MRWIVLLAAWLLAGPALAQGVTALQLQPGDLLFVTASQNGLSGAIDDATARAGQVSYDHVALVAGSGEQAQVLHADQLGSREQPLAVFLREAGEKQRQIDAYRLRDADPQVIADGLDQARRLLGKPYNATYVPDEDSLYCSDFIERAFRAHGIFALQPMNFRNPRTGVIADWWVQFYAGHGMDVPQDVPGSNPNDMARDPDLQPLGQVLH